MTTKDIKEVAAGWPIRDTISQDVLERLPREVVEGGVWGEMCFARFNDIYLTGKSAGDMVSETIAACVQDKEGNELLTVAQVGALPLSVGKELSACVTYVQRQAGTANLDEELSDPKL